jgi:hypothetical protein
MKLSELLGKAQVALLSRDIVTLAAAVGAVNLEYTKRRSRLDISESLADTDQLFRMHLEHYRAICGPERAASLATAYNAEALQAALPTKEDYAICDSLEFVEVLKRNIAPLEANPLRDLGPAKAALDAFIAIAPDIEIGHGILVATGFVTETQLCLI